MPTLEPGEHPLIALCEPVFASLVERGEIDLVEVPREEACEIQADAWTLHLAGWPVTSGFVALDEEPASRTERLLALDAAIDQRHLAALRQANALLEGAIAAVLIDSGDDLSTLLGEALATVSDQEDDELLA